MVSQDDHTGVHGGANTKEYGVYKNEDVSGDGKHIKFVKMWEHP